MKNETLELKDFVGRHVLDAVDMISTKVGDEDAQCVIFRLDGVVYCAQENPVDGWRSLLKDVRVIQDVPKNVFPAEEVIVEHDTRGEDLERGDLGRDVLVMRSVKTEGDVLEFGTLNTDDYYPLFVHRFMPQNLSCNRGKNGN